MVLEGKGTTMGSLGYSFTGLASYQLGGPRAKSMYCSWDLTGIIDSLDL